ncbi:MAG: choice-of-anchor Q domain-containing protein [Caldilineaceae bacterium]
MISGNSASNSGAEIYNFNATINAANFNLIGYGGDARSYNFTPSGSDIVPSQALAAILDTTLADNGGPSTGSGTATFTHALVTGSPAIDAAGGSALIATDQRGITRPQGADVVSGAFELAPPANARLNGTDCTLIDAMIAANTDTATGACAAGTAGADTITLLDDVTLTASNNFALNSDNGLPGITSEITIEGAGYTISRDVGAPAFRLLLVMFNGNLTLHQTTLSGGDAGTGNGGAIYNNSGTVTVSDSTLSGNTASGSGGGIYNYNSGTLNLARSLITGNSAANGGAEIYDYNSAGTITAANFNLIGYGGDARSTNFTPSGSDIVPSQALAAILDTALADNGGPSTSSGQATFTHALVTGSPALNAAGDSGLATDQRGITRPQGAADDIGAFELEVVPATITIVLDTQPDLSTNLGFSGSLGAFLLDDPAVDDSDAYTNTKSFSVAPGVYTVRRNNATGWFLTDITCTPAGKAAINLFQRRATLTVASGDSVTCTYTVQQAARILARAFNDLVRNSSNLGKRNVGDPWVQGWAMSVFRAPNALVANGSTSATSTAGLYQASFTTLQPGSYTVCATLPAASWTPTTPNATNPDYGKPCKAVTLAPGQAATVRFGAYKPTVVASEAFTPEDERITDEDTIINLPYDPAEDETATDEDGLPRLFLPLVVR